MKKKKTSIRQNKPFMITVLVALIIILLSGLLSYRLAYQKYHSSTIPTENMPGYITAHAARNQVNDFYYVYLHPRKDTPEESRRLSVSIYGDKNLVFYSKYYQHGFDPIVCSTAMPTSVAATSVKPGPGAVVNAEAKYPDGSTANIVLTLVLNNEGFGIDSITCPGALGNLPPQT